ncbi:MAG: hypothetical protein GY847_06585 [Proteobacteria bacterium]|nr:hypothetical protein [Pseudomonadota bacterium]
MGSSDPLLLLAIAGDDEYTSPKNTGLPTLEISEIVSADGDNDAWTTQSASVPAGRATHGHGALVYFDFLFTFGGVDRETLGGNPSQMKNAASRFEYHGAAGDNDILQNYQSTSASFETSRSYYEMVRLNGYNFVIGGNDKTGPVASIERTLQ